MNDLQKQDFNVSQVQFRHSRFLDGLRATLQEALTGLLEQIRRTDAGIAIDDFGTGKHARR